MVPESHRFVKKGFWPKSDFAAERWIAVQEDTGGVDDLKNGLSNFGIVPDFSASTNSIEAALNYVSIGLGIALMALPPLSMLEHRKLKAIPVSEEFGSISINILRLNSNSIEQSIINSFIKSAKQVGRELQESVI